MPARLTLPSLAAAILLLPPPADAQTGTPASEARAERAPAADARATADDDREWWRSMADGVRWLRDRGIHPEAGVITAGSGLAFGASFRQPNVRGTGWGGEAGAMWSIRGYEAYELRLGLVGDAATTVALRPPDARAHSQFNDRTMTSPGLAAYLDVRYRDYPRVNFYGIGPDVELDDRRDYRVAGTSVEGVMQWQIDDDLGVAGRFGILDLDVRRGANGAVPDLHDIGDPGGVPGLASQPRFVTAGAGVVLDDRNSPDLPTSGTFAGLSVWRFASLNDTAYDFTRLTLDARGFFAPAGERRVLALRLLASADWSPDGRVTPFYLQHHLGGSETLRGYPSYLYRGRALVHGSAEYRWRLHRMVEVAPFVDLGAVASRPSSLALSGLKATPGVGLRLRNDDRVLFRIDVAYRPGALRLSFGMSPPF